MYTHIKTVGILYIALGVYGLFGPLVALLAMAGIAIVPGFLLGGPILGLGASAAVGLVGLVLIAFSAFTSLLGILGGFGLLQWKQWARVLLIVLGALMLTRFPFGTVLGIYTLWVLLRGETGDRFEHKGAGPLSYTW